MSDTDKTKEKLVNSIRKSRASADEDKQAAEMTSRSRPADAEKASKQTPGTYRSGPRVWPD